MNMIEVKTSELSGKALDWAVCFVEAQELVGMPINKETQKMVMETFRPPFSPSTNWSQCGPLIENYSVEITFNGSPEFKNYWCAYFCGKLHYERGDTPLIAACRAIVAAKMGDVVSVPAELVGVGE